MVDTPVRLFCDPPFSFLPACLPACLHTDPTNVRANAPKPLKTKTTPNPHHTKPVHPMTAAAAAQGETPAVVVDQLMEEGASYQRSNVMVRAGWLAGWHTHFSRRRLRTTPS